MNKELPQRRMPAHPPAMITPNRSIIVFATVCTNARKAILAKPPVHDLCLSAWQHAAAWTVGRYVIMPDHIHLFCAPGCPAYPPLKQWIHFWKSLVSRQWPWPEEQPIWQKSFWDRQLRIEESYADKWEYVRQNPVRAGLCAQPDDWPYQGELNELRWHD